MKQKTLYILWAFLFILCAGLGFIPKSEGLGTAVLVVLCLAFFLTGGMLLYGAYRHGDVQGVRRIRIISAASLGITLVLLVANFLCANASQTVGNLLYGLLVILSSPMVCGRYWVISLFLWACLLMASFTKPKAVNAG